MLFLIPITTPIQLAATVSCLLSPTMTTTTILLPWLHTAPHSHQYTVLGMMAPSGPIVTQTHRYNTLYIFPCWLPYDFSNETLHSGYTGVSQFFIHQVLPTSLNPRTPDKSDSIYSYRNKTVSGAASIGTSLVVFLKQNQILTASQHLQSLHKTLSFKHQTHESLAHMVALDYLLAREGGGCAIQGVFLPLRPGAGVFN